MKRFLFVIFIISAGNACSWNSVGHKLTAQIAYDNMSTKSKKVINKYNRLLNTKGRKYSIIDSSVWMDTLYSQRYKDFRGLHYVDIPLLESGISAPKLKNYNAIFAVQNSEKILRDPKASQYNKAISFRILWHVVADLHQPMHAISKYSKRHPTGDRGGNLEILPKNKVAKNLHAYWDRGGGAFYSRKPFSKKQIKELELFILNKWPCDKNHVNLNPETWAQESYNISVKFAYVAPFNYQYQRKTQEISLERIALAGCRLAALIDESAVLYQAR